MLYCGKRIDYIQKSIAANIELTFISKLLLSNIIAPVNNNGSISFQLEYSKSKSQIIEFSYPNALILIDDSIP